jgi:hypothetical protein
MTNKSKKELCEEFPTELVLRFKSNAARNYFMGQLSDGWGEGCCAARPIDADTMSVEVWDVRTDEEIIECCGNEGSPDCHCNS